MCREILWDVSQHVHNELALIEIAGHQKLRCFPAQSPALLLGPFFQPGISVRALTYTQRKKKPFLTDLACWSTVQATSGLGGRRFLPPWQPSMSRPRRSQIAVRYFRKRRLSDVRGGGFASKKKCLVHTIVNGKYSLQIRRILFLYAKPKNGSRNPAGPAKGCYHSFQRSDALLIKNQATCKTYWVVPQVNILTDGRLEYGTSFIPKLTSVDIRKSAILTVVSNKRIWL